MPGRAPGIQVRPGRTEKTGMDGISPVMTGGGAQLRGLDWLLAQETGLPIHVDREPLTCVVRGAGLVLEDWGTYRSVVTV